MRRSPTKSRSVIVVFSALLLLWAFCGLWEIGRSEVRKIEEQNQRTAQRFIQWVQLLGKEGQSAFGSEELEAFWHGDFLHPNVPVMLMAIAGKTGEAVSLTRMRTVPFAFGLMAIAVLVLWARAEHGALKAGAIGILALLYPHILRRSCIASTGTAVAALWISLLWMLSRPRKHLSRWILAGVVFGVGLGTKITILILPIAYGMATCTCRSVEDDSRSKLLVGWLTLLTTGFMTHVALWPWLWRDPIGNLYRHVMENRLQVDTTILFFGKPLTQPPFFYPLWFLLTTVPIPLIVLFGAGVVRIVRNKTWRTSLWAGLHFWTVFLFLCIFCFPVKSSLNGAEYFLPALFSMATLSLDGVHLLAGDRAQSSLSKPFRVLLVFVALTIASLSISLLWSGDLFTMRNLIGNLLHEPFSGAF